MDESYEKHYTQVIPILNGSVIILIRILNFFLSKSLINCIIGKYYIGTIHLKVEHFHRIPFHTNYHQRMM